MTRFNRRRIRTTRRFARPAAKAETLPPIELPPNAEASTEFAVEAVKAQSAPSSQQDSTVELAAMPKGDPNDETAEVVSVALPEPPNRLAFTCPCGADLIATADMYDKHTRCALCRTVVLVNLVYDAESRSHEIVAFRVNPES